jgi:hypothetical protein
MNLGRGKRSFTPTRDVVVLIHTYIQLRRAQPTDVNLTDL